MSFQTAVLLFVVAMVAGAVNSVAGGGTLLTFPTLFWVLHNNGLVANATSTVALWPGQLSSLFGYRKEIGKNRETIALMAVPSLLGGGAGALLLLHTSSSAFDRIVPFLILLATVLFMVQEPLSRYFKRKKPPVTVDSEETDSTGIPESVPSNSTAPNSAPGNASHPGRYSSSCWLPCTEDISA